MAKKSRTYTNEDSQGLTRATSDALQKYSESGGPVRVSSILQEFGGSKSALAREIAGIGEGKLPAKGTAERTRYDTASRNIGRYLASESGSGKQSRNPNKETQARLKQIQAKKRPPSSMSITITGYIGYDDDFRFRTVSTSLPQNGATAQQFLAHMQNGNVSEAYQDVFQAYKVGRGIITVADDNPDISIDFTGDGSNDGEAYDDEEE